MAMNVEAEIRDLKRRVSELEGSFGFLTNQVKGVHKDLLGFQEKTEQRFDRIDGRFEQVDGSLRKVDGRLDHVEKASRTCATTCPELSGTRCTKSCVSATRHHASKRASERA